MQSPPVPSPHRRRSWRISRFPGFLLAIASDLYYRGSRLGCLRTIMSDLGKRRGRTFDDIHAAQRGSQVTTAAPALAAACPIVGSFGGSDRSPLGRRTGARMQQIQPELDVEHDVKIHPGIGMGS